MTQKRLPLTLHLWQVWLNKRSSAFDPGHAAAIGGIVSNNIKFQAKFSFSKQVLRLDKHRIHQLAMPAR